jgi:hypothetical protein
MKKINFRPLYVLAFLILVCNLSFAQSDSFKLDGGKAIIKRTFPLHGKSASEVYKNVNRWLVKYYSDPEDNLKARIEDEYLRGVGYQRGLIQYGALTASDLQYTFIVKLNDQQAEFTITDVVIIHDSPRTLMVYIGLKIISGHQ